MNECVNMSICFIELLKLKVFFKNEDKDNHFLCLQYLDKILSTSASTLNLL
jgi:hypothetical protein